MSEPTLEAENKYLRRLDVVRQEEVARLHEEIARLRGLLAGLAYYHGGFANEVFVADDDTESAFATGELFIEREDEDNRTRLYLARAMASNE